MKTIKTFVGVAFSAGFCLIAGADDFSAWGRKAQITFSGYTGTETLMNFPALVVLGPASIGGFDYVDCLEDGTDLRFIDATGLIELPYEIEQWNPAGLSYVWVRVPELAGTATFITARWGNPGATTPAYTTNGTVWANGYVGVWHLQRPNAPDSTASANNGTALNNVDATGKIGTAQSFTGTARISCGTGSSLNLPSQLTVEAWVKPSALGGARPLPRRRRPSSSNSMERKSASPRPACLTMTRPVRDWSTAPGRMSGLRFRKARSVDANTIETA